MAVSQHTPDGWGFSSVALPLSFALAAQRGEGAPDGRQNLGGLMSAGDGEREKCEKDVMGHAFRTGEREKCEKDIMGHAFRTGSPGQKPQEELNFG